MYSKPGLTWNRRVGAAGRGLALGTEQATTSGTTADITGIAPAKRITFMLDGVSTDGTSNLELKLGPVGGIEETGYVGRNLRWTTSAVAGTDWAADAISVATNMIAANPIYGTVILTLQDETNNVWMVTGTATKDTGESFTLAGSKPLAGRLTQLRLTSASADTFDLGSINILVE